MIDNFIAYGDPDLKLAMKTQYIPALYKILDKCAWKKEVLSFLPLGLRKEYNKLVRKQKKEQVHKEL